MVPNVAVVGAGVAGTAAVRTLDAADAEVTLFERAGRVGGRAATRTRGDCAYDYGANYVKSDDERVAALLSEDCATGLIDTEGPVYTFDADEQSSSSPGSQDHQDAEGSISEGDDADEYKWTYEDGIETLATRLLEGTDAAVETRSEVTALRRDGEAWFVGTDSAEEAFGPFDALVLTPPAPQTGDLLVTADWAHPRKSALCESLHDVSYRVIWSVVLHYPFELDRPYYALVNTDRAHDVGWLSREECKPGHVPDGESLLIVQMAPDWSDERYDADGEDVVAAALPFVADLLDDERLADPDWTDSQRWGLALPDEGVDPALLDAVADDGLFFAGDWVAGEARAHAAIRTGLETGERIGERF
jgi:predicted NAD/FAD-dependent oxidoreductase